MRLDQLENPNTDLHILAAWLRNRDLEVELRDHPLAEQAKLLDVKLLATMSPHQLHVYGPYGKISVIRGGASFGDYEILSLEGELFDGIRRYRKVEHAGKTIHMLLNTGMFDESVPQVFAPIEHLGKLLFGEDDKDGGDGPVQEIIE